MQDEGFEPFPLYPVLLDMKGDTLDVDTAASSDMYLGTLKEPPPGSPKTSKPRPRLPGVKVGVDAQRYVEKIKPMPTEGGTFQIRSRLIAVSAKGSGALTETESELFDPASGDVYYRFVSGGFSIGAHSFKDGGTTSPAFAVTVPDREPDVVVEEHVDPRQAHVYRLSGDYNPLHIDPEFPGVAGGGFRAPILHGLCTMGHTIRQVFKEYCGNDASKFKACAVRFSSPVIPGETLVTKMWKDGDRVAFIAEVKETGKVCISNAYLDLGASPKL